MNIDLGSLDFFQMKLLHNKPGTFYIRNGEVFIYQGIDKYLVDPNRPATFELSSEPTIDDLKLKDIDTSKDIKYDGFFVMNQIDQYYVLAFKSPTIKVIQLLKCGDVLKEI
jgi:hypothetical protein